MLNGSHTDVVVKNGVVEKTIGGKGEAFSQMQALNLLSGMYGYRRMLQKTGLKVPEIYEGKITGTGQETIITLLCQNAGSDLEALARQGELKIVDVARKICQELEKLFGLRTPKGDLTVGIDPKPANFCLGQDSVVRYVDLMPPRHREAHGVIEYPEPKTLVGKHTAYWRAFTPEGVLVVLLSQLSRIQPKERERFVKMLSRMTKNFSPPRETTFMASGAIGFALLPTYRKFEQIESLTTADMYRGRNMACELVACTNKLSARSDLETIFRQTHFAEGLTDEQLRLLKANLKGLALGQSPMEG